jgi:hypothetical protein
VSVEPSSLGARVVKPVYQLQTACRGLQRIRVHRQTTVKRKFWTSHTTSAHMYVQCRFRPQQIRKRTVQSLAPQLPPSSFVDVVPAFVSIHIQRRPGRIYVVEVAGWSPLVQASDLPFQERILQCPRRLLRLLQIDACCHLAC